MKIRGQQVYTPDQRIKRLSKLDPVTGCIVWQGSKRNGYGRLMVGSRTDMTRKSVSAHRYAYEAYIGEIPKGKLVCHSCDNPACVNPNHLWLGTHQDNINDRERKGRNNHTRKLSDRDIKEIHDSKNIISSKKLATKFDVSYHTIKHIWMGRLYPKLKPTPPKGGDDET